MSGQGTLDLTTIKKIAFIHVVVPLGNDDCNCDEVV